MLDKVKSTLQNAMNSDVEFPDLFQEYLMHVQDINIENEINFLLRNNTSILGIDMLLSEEYRR